MQLADGPAGPGCTWWTSSRARRGAEEELARWAPGMIRSTARALAHQIQKDVQVRNNSFSRSTQEKLSCSCRVLFGAGKTIALHFSLWLVDVNCSMPFGKTPRSGERWSKTSISPSRLQNETSKPLPWSLKPRYQRLAIKFLVQVGVGPIFSWTFSLSQVFWT